MAGKSGGQSQGLPWILLVILALMWGSSFILIKKALVAFDPGVVGALRIVSASLFLLIPAFKRISRIRRNHILKLLTLGFVGSLIPSFLFAKAQTQLDSSIAGVLNALTPLFVIIFGIVFFYQRITWRILFGVLLGFLGTTWLVMAGSGGDMSVNFYALFIVVATICYGLNVNLIKFKLADLSALTITSISLSMVGPMAAVYLFWKTDFLMVLQSNPEAWVSFGAAVLLGLMGTAVALIIFNKLVQITTPVFSSSVTYLIPIVALGWGIMDGETLVMGQIGGMFLILIGVSLANRIKGK